MADIAPKSGEFHDGKFWFERKGSIITLGLTSSAVDDIGAVEGVELPDEGADFSKGEVVVTVDGSGGKLELITPASGIIQEVNQALEEEPERVSEDPLEEGWIVKMEIEDTSDLKEYSIPGE
jgi:glycine cleavage system H protein